MSKYSECKIDSLEDIFSFLDEMRKTTTKFIYRGQGNANWKLRTSLERNLNILREHILKNDEDSMWRAFIEVNGIEQSVLYDFKRMAHHFISQDIPDDEDIIEWLSLIQHYHGQTRLLDFTYSFFVALYFAIVDNLKDRCHAAVYILNPFVVNQLGKLIKDVDTNSKIVKNKNIPRNEYWSYHLAEIVAAYFLDKREIIKLNPYGVIIVEPYRKNKRILMQNGCFLFPLNTGVPLVRNLEKMFDNFVIKENNYESLAAIRNIKEFKIAELIDHALLKLIIPEYLKNDIYYYLMLMNINDNTLFPDLNGALKGISRKFDPHKTPNFDKEMEEEKKFFDFLKVSKNQ